MSERSDELRRQRELVRQQLAWLDSEIAAQEAEAPPIRASAPPLPVPESPPEMTDAEAILSEFRRPAASIQTQAKRGCILYFSAAMALLLLGVAVVYLYARSLRGH